MLHRERVTLDINAVEAWAERWRARLVLPPIDALVIQLPDGNTKVVQSFDSVRMQLLKGATVLSSGLSQYDFSDPLQALLGNLFINLDRCKRARRIHNFDGIARACFHTGVHAGAFLERSSTAHEDAERLREGRRQGAPVGTAVNKARAEERRRCVIELTHAQWLKMPNLIGSFLPTARVLRRHWKRHFGVECPLSVRSLRRFYLQRIQVWRP